MCTTEPEATVHDSEGRLLDPTGRCVILLGLDIIELSRAAGNSAAMNTFAFLAQLVLPLERGEVLTISFGTPHSWKHYEAMSPSQLGEAFDYSLPRCEHFTLREGADPSKWYARNFDARRLLPHLPPGTADVQGYLLEAVRAATSRNIGGLDDVETICSPLILREWISQGRPDFPLHEALLRGPKPAGFMFRFGVRAYSATAPAGGKTQLDAGRAPLYYATPPEVAYKGARKRLQEPAVVAHLLIQVTMLSPRAFSSFEPDIHYWRDADLQMPSGGFATEGRWAAVFGPFSREPDGVDDLRKTEWTVSPACVFDSERQSNAAYWRLAFFLFEQEARPFVAEDVWEVLPMLRSEPLEEALAKATQLVIGSAHGIEIPGAVTPKGTVFRIPEAGIAALADWELANRHLLRLTSSDVASPVSPITPSGDHVGVQTAREGSQQADHGHALTALKTQYGLGVEHAAIVLAYTIQEQSAPSFFIRKREFMAHLGHKSGFPNLKKRMFEALQNHGFRGALEDAINDKSSLGWRFHQAGLEAARKFRDALSSKPAWHQIQAIVSAWPE